MQIEEILNFFENNIDQSFETRQLSIQIIQKEQIIPPTETIEIFHWSKYVKRLQRKPQTKTNI